MEHEQWTGRTGGTRLMQRSLIGLFRLTGPRLLYGVMALVVPFYMLFSRRSYRAIYGYYRRRRQLSPLRAFVKVYANHYAFGQIILDRFAVYAGRRFDVDIVGNEAFLKAADADEGALMLGSHTGNFELCGYTLHSTRKRLNAVVFGGETETVMANRGRQWERHNIRMIPVRDDLSHLFAINSALSDGEIVCMTADRVFGSAKTLTCTFMGRPARFPQGPFAVALRLHVSVLALFVMKAGLKAYRVYVEPIELTAEERQLPRSEQTQRLAEHFVARLERIVNLYPDQWFNYYDFWEDE